MFLHNSRSDNGRKTSAPAVCRRISVASLTFMAGFPQTGFDTKLVNFFLKLVLPVILKELQSNFLISTIASCDSYASLVLSNLPRASITPWLHAARLPFLNLLVRNVVQLCLAANNILLIRKGNHAFLLLSIAPA